jgi:hypothetical protein
MSYENGSSYNRFEPSGENYLDNLDPNEREDFVLRMYDEARTYFQENP